GGRGRARPRRDTPRCPRGARSRGSGGSPATRRRTRSSSCRVSYSPSVLLPSTLLGRGPPPVAAQYIFGNDSYYEHGRTVSTPTPGRRIKSASPASAGRGTPPALRSGRHPRRPPRPEPQSRVGD